MNLVEHNSIINKICRMKVRELDAIELDVYLISIARETDQIFLAKKEIIDDKLREWLKKSLARELRDLRVVDESGNKSLKVAEYSHEISKKDYLARFDLNENKDIKDQKNKLIASLTTNESLAKIGDEEFDVQLIKVILDEEEVYILYKRGLKKTGISKKNASRMPTVRHGNKLIPQNDDIIEFGGKIELFIYEDAIFISNPKSFETIFNYSDHVTLKRDLNLTLITSMDFFDNETDSENFTKRATNGLLSRGLADIKKETLLALEENFEKRCNELITIKENIPKDEKEKEEYKEKFKPIWPLYDHLDINEKKVRFNTDKPVTPLIHFFSDKIVESFLSKQFRV